MHLQKAEFLLLHGLCYMHLTEFTVEIKLPWTEDPILTYNMLGAERLLVIWPYNGVFFLQNLLMMRKSIKDV